MLLRIPLHNTHVDGSHRIGLALFALGVIMFFGQRYVRDFFAILASRLMPPDIGAYQIILQSSIVIYSIAMIMLILGAVMFYKARKENVSVST